MDTQEALLALGYEIGDIDGLIGKQSRDAIRNFERSQGSTATGRPSADLLKQMRKVALERGLSRPDVAPAP